MHFFLQVISRKALTNGMHGTGKKVTSLNFMILINHMMVSLMGSIVDFYQQYQNICTNGNKLIEHCGKSKDAI